MLDINIIYAMCGSFCTFDKAFEEIKSLKKSGANIIPCLSFNAANIDTRFGKAEDIKKQLIEITGNEIICTIEAAEPIGPKRMADVLIVAPCTGNTLAKLSLGITDTPVTMACKSHLRNGRPVVIALSTNDALSASFSNLGRLMNTRNYYFVPLSQDDFLRKPNSLQADFSLREATIESAMRGKQIQPVFH